MISYTTNTSNAKRNLYKLIDMAIENETEICICTKKGNIVMISENEYRSVLETLFLSFNDKYKKSIVDGLKIPYEQTISEDKINNKYFGFKIR